MKTGGPKRPSAPTGAIPTGTRSTGANRKRATAKRTTRARGAVPTGDIDEMEASRPSSNADFNTGDTSGPIAGRGAVGAQLVSTGATAAELVTSADSLAQAREALWARRNEVAMQPHPGSALRIIGGNCPERPATVKPDTYIKDLLAVAMERPPGSPTTSKSDQTFDQFRGRIRRAVRGEVKWSAVARDPIYIDRAGTDPTTAKEVLFIHANPEQLPKLVALLTQRMVDKPESFPGLHRLKVSGPYKSGRPDNLSLSTDGGESTAQVLAALKQLQASAPELFGKTVPPMTEAKLPGVGVGDLDLAGRYKDEAFGAIRSQVLHSAAVDAVAANLDKQAFDALLDQRLAEAGIDATQPHRFTADVNDVSDEVVGVPGAAPMTAGVQSVAIPGFGGKGSHSLDVEISKPVAARLARKKAVRFLPEQGMFVKVDVDRTRDPPRERVVKQFPASFIDDTRYRLEFGEMAPPFVHYDEATSSYHIPKKVTLEPPGKYGNFSLSTEVSPERQSRKAPPQVTLVRKLNDGAVQGEALDKVMGKIEGYVTDPKASGVQRVVLEEGTNGVSVLSLSNRAVGVWKPSAAEYPEQARLNLEPDHQARREAFAYFLSKRLGHLGRVPPTVFRDIDGESGTLSALSRGTMPGSHSSQLAGVLADPTHPVYQQLAVFDCIIGNLDRHSGNLLFAKDTALAIDHGMAFPLAHGEQGEMNFIFDAQVALTSDQKVAIAELLKDKEAVRAEALELTVAPEAVELMFERMETMLKLGTTYDGWRTG